MLDNLINKGIQLTEENIKLKKEIAKKDQVFNELLQYVLEVTNYETSEILDEIIRKNQA